jgi:hypothetical protein
MPLLFGENVHVTYSPKKKKCRQHQQQHKRVTTLCGIYEMACTALKRFEMA